MKYKMYFLIISILSSFFLTACDQEPKEIMIASKPTGATVYMEDAEIGVTPMVITVSKETKIDLKKQGFAPYSVLLSPASEPNHIVSLEAKSTEFKELDFMQEPFVVQDPANTQAPVVQQEQAVNQKSAAVPKTTEKNTPPPPKKKAPRLTITRVKAMYNQGKISKQEYSQQVRQLKYQMKSELARLKERYNRGELSKSDYNQRARQIKYFYIG